LLLTDIYDNSNAEPIDVQCPCRCLVVDITLCLYVLPHHGHCTRLSTISDRAFPVATVRVCRTQHVTYAPSITVCLPQPR